MSRPGPITLLVTDLDNTLWDWFQIWYRSFSALLEGIVAVSGVSQDELLPQIRAIHQQRGTAEYSYLIQEIPALLAQHPAEELPIVYRDAIRASKDARREASKLYPGVLDTLRVLRERGVTIAGYTESLAYYSAYRLRTLGLDGVVQYLYSPPDHDLPTGVKFEQLRSKEADTYALKETVHRHTPPGVLKPDDTVLRAVVDELGGAEGNVYVGDSLMKDIAMAQDAGVIDVYAAYGVAPHGAAYDLLRAVTHWTDADVERERAIDARPDVTPTYVLRESFAELLALF